MFNVTSIQVNSAGLVDFYVGSDVVRSLNSEAPTTSTFVIYGNTSITFILPETEKFEISVCDLTQVGGTTYTAIGQLARPEAIRQRVKDVYTDLVSNIFVSNNAVTSSGGAFTEYTYDSALGAGNWYFVSGQMFMSFTTDLGQDFTNLLHHYSDTWVNFRSKTDSTKYSVFELTSYVAVSGLASWTATLIAGESSYANGTEFYVSFDNSGGGAGSQDLQQTLDNGAVLNKDNTIDGNTHDLFFTDFGKIDIDSPLNLSALTASQILALDGLKNVQSLATSTYPSLTEFSYVKGVTSAIQTQLDAKKQIISLSGGNVGGTIAAGVTSYLAPTVDAAPGGTEANRASVIVFAGNAKNFYYTTLTAQPGTGSFVLTIRKATGMGAFSSTAVTITIAAGSAAGIFSDVVNTASFSAGDRMSIQITNNASGASAQIGTWQLLIEA